MDWQLFAAIVTLAAVVSNGCGALMHRQVTRAWPARDADEGDDGRPPR